MKKELIQDIASGVGILVLALGASLARQQGYIDEDATIRIVLCAIGLQIAWFGNRMPKRIAPSNAARKVTRVGGWSLALSGLVYASFWVFAPIPVAVVGGCAAVILGIAVTVFYCLSLRSKANAA
ncbi:ammonium transporter [Brevundimonas lenta]|uniref:Ammonium transporter n=1 Tax=Brevundimonas lenta TaxID=424796 RepID=A0A7W6NNJ3_9CAUL|nr:ammonium transporter [Brevundimonas lenta]MBB4081215.1 hypothetical protein [Brevundimonas lenta]